MNVEKILQNPFKESFQERFVTILKHIAISRVNLEWTIPWLCRFSSTQMFLVDHVKGDRLAMHGCILSRCMQGNHLRVAGDLQHECRWQRQWWRTWGWKRWWTPAPTKATRLLAVMSHHHACMDERCPSVQTMLRWSPTLGPQCRTAPARTNSNHAPNCASGNYTYLNSPAANKRLSMVPIIHQIKCLDYSIESCWELKADSRFSKEAFFGLRINQLWIFKVLTDNIQSADWQ